MRLTAGARSFRSTDTGPLFVRIWGGGIIADVTITDALTAGATLAAATHDVPIDLDAWSSDSRGIRLLLYERLPNDIEQHDLVVWFEGIREAGTCGHAPVGGLREVGH